VSSTNAYSSQSEPWISGIPVALEPDLDGEKIVSAAAAAALVGGRAALLDDMGNTPSWKPYIGKVTMEWDGSHFSYGFVGTDEDIQAMRDLEYGTGAQPATNLLSKSIFRLSDRVQQDIEDAVLTAAFNG
jgi:hypothetical protein